MAVSEAVEKIRFAGQSAVNDAFERMPIKARETLALHGYGLTKVPMVFFVGPRVEELTLDRSVIRIPHSFRTRDQGGALYAGALTMGAELAVGLIGMRTLRSAGSRVELSVKGMDMKVHRRIERDGIFVCNEGAVIREAVREAQRIQSQVNRMARVYCFPDGHGHDEPAATFDVTFTCKARPVAAVARSTRASR